MDDFAPKHKYPESLREFDQICAQARAKGMTYGKFIEMYGNSLPKPKVKNPDLIRCRQCGDMFMPPRLKNGELSIARKRCQKCIDAGPEINRKRNVKNARI